MTVITGLSGSGKSSLAFDTIYSEGQRRYIESLSAYARQYMEQLKKPDVESIKGLSPSIAIDQKTITNNPRSTVGTLTEIYDYVRLLYARVGKPLCPTHGVPVSSQSPQQIVDEVLKLPAKTKYFVLAPVAQLKKGEFGKEFKKWASKGFVKAKVDGAWVDLVDMDRLEKNKRHDIDILVDRLLVEEKFNSRLKESIHQSLVLADGKVKIEVVGKEAQLYSIHNACPECGFSFPELEPRLFSFNNPRGACETCNGMGYIEEEVEFEDDDDLYYDEVVCPDCEGKRLKPMSLSVLLNEKNIFEVGELTVDELLEFLKQLDLNSRDTQVAEKIVMMIESRLQYLLKVGTHYLSLNRPTKTLSGGETQRIRLATQMGSSLIGVLYVLDEPSIGLHPRDHHRLLDIIHKIRDRGNTILLVEHDEDTIRSADHVIDMGPGAGRLGGEILAEGTPYEIEQNPKSITGRFLSHKDKIEVPKNRRSGNGLFIEVIGASGNNLKNVHLKIPLGSFVGVTGVSGSGKSTLIRETLYKHIAHELYQSQATPAPFKEMKGLEHIDKVIEISQKPIGRTPRSIPATYVGLFPLIRGLFSALPEAKVRGYKPGHFSFNVKGGRCEHCQGAGRIKVEMHFLSDVYVLCDFCQGLRYNSEILNIRYKDKNISDVLNMTVDEALNFFTHHQLIYRKLETLQRVGLGYISLGQSSTTLSGGEAQRVKLSKELSKRGTGRTFYILDEPTTGLHFADIKRLVSLLHELVDQGNTVLVIEHNLDVVKNCDHVIDLGPDGGRFGGEIIFSGSPESLINSQKSETGKFLKPLLEK
ncbi:MAG: excinuclease ABC subunit UvrA [Bdellovibrionales bacterium]|nr:excinuclease ABC subunit UvrA [Bdellovibrionales bacterium]